MKRLENDEYRRALLDEIEKAVNEIEVNVHSGEL
ncbi:hypothetical protein SAMN04489841_3609 [Natrinema salaciae]|uniref:Uncharacterized protein n=1 Tax=Natrinema salaciae TaxID=1186196 RepID=A0A1H9NIQ9_9EURY|nr:hypothetical protein SAMN04489841_3609 [Natrinema salaciae]